MDAAIAAIQNGDTLITAGRRLAREIILEFDRRQIAAGNNSWARSDVLPAGAWVRRAWQASGAPGLILEDGQLISIWMRIINENLREQDTATGPLWNIHATAKNAIDSWRLACEWRIQLQDCARSPHYDHQRWLNWALRFEKLCSQNNWHDEYSLPANLCAWLNKNKSADDAFIKELRARKIVWFGFDHITPHHLAIISEIEQCGVKVEIMNTPAERARDIKMYAFESDEWLAAARWARKKLTANPEAKIAICAPRLDAVVNDIENSLKQILCPQQLIKPATRDHLPYHISLGKNLLRYPAVAAVLVVLRVCVAMQNKTIARDDLRALVRSPFIAGADSEAIERAQLDLILRRAPQRIAWRWLLNQLSDCPILKNKLTDARANIKIPKQNSFSSWARNFTEWLAMLGWHGERALTSDEHQSISAYQKEIRALVLLDTTASATSARGALRWLQQRLEERVLQTQAQAAPVQVLSVAESAGLKFDALWFGGLNTDDWPPPTYPSAFIEIKLQREVGVLAASADGINAAATRAQQRLLAAADEVVLSYTREEDGVQIEASALLGEFAETAADQNLAQQFPTAAQIIYEDKPQLQEFSDERAAVPAQTQVSGGISVIADQAQCPFRAFAIHRLGAREYEETQQGLDAMQRGTLLHRALQLLWEEIRNSKKLHSLSDDGLDKIIATAVATADKESQKFSGGGLRFHKVQRAWAADALRDWLEVDKNRAEEFEVIACEQQVELELNGLRLRFKIDRIDKIADANLLLIDYKTGARVDANWLHGRETTPQLPLYALAHSEEVASLAYAKVRRGECKFVGISTHPKIAEHKDFKEIGVDLIAYDANELKDQWREIFAQLADEFMHGDARVAPLNDACEQCDLHGLCRIQADSV